MSYVKIASFGKFEFSGISNGVETDAAIECDSLAMSNLNLTGNIDHTDNSLFIIKNSGYDTIDLMVNNGSTTELILRIQDDKIILYEDVVVGRGDAGKDYTITFNGQTNDGIIKWDEGNDKFIIPDDIDLEQNITLGGDYNDSIIANGCFLPRVLSGDPTTTSIYGKHGEIAYYNDNIYLKTVDTGTNTNWKKL